MNAQSLQSTKEKKNGTSVPNDNHEKSRKKKKEERKRRLLGIKTPTEN